MKQILRPTLLAVAATAALGMTVGAAAQTNSAPPHVSKADASYVVGWQMAGSLPKLVRDEIDPTLVANAVKAALMDQKPTMSKEKFESTSKAFMAELQAKAKVEFDKVAAQNKREGDAFLAKNKTAPGVHTTASGLQYQVISQGTGPRPGANDTVQLQYTGSFLNGDVFDASAKHPEPAGGKSVPIPLSGVIPGFREGLQLMQVGGHYKLFIPSTLAYGSQPKNGFPPNATIIFDVTLEKISHTPPSQSDSSGGE